MAIKPEVDQAYFTGREKQREIALRLDEAFDITFADIHAGFAIGWPARNHTRANGSAFNRKSWSSTPPIAPQMHGFSPQLIASDACRRSSTALRECYA